MRRTADETAVLVALLLARSGQKRARVSEKTIRRLAKRRRLRTAFLSMLRQHLEDRSLVMMELDDGSWGLIPSKGLQGAPTITAARFLAEDLEKLKKNPDAAWKKFREELEAEEGVEDEEE
jgi:hypothetical protein